MEWLLEIALIVLLAATMFHALRLEKALGVLKRDRAALEELVNGFNGSTQRAEQGIERLRAAADGARRQIARQIEAATGLKDDLVFLAERGERLADRIDALIRAGRQLAPENLRPFSSELPQRAEALLPDTMAETIPDAPRFVAPQVPPVSLPDSTTPRLRSQAERDLLRALRMGR
jgi:hypothetical protein